MFQGPAPILFQGPVSEGSLTTAAEMPLSTCEDEEEEEDASKVPTGGPPPGTPTAAPEQAVTFVSASPSPPHSLWLTGGREVSILRQEQLPPSQPQRPIQLVRTPKGAGGGTNFSSFHGGSMAEGPGSRYLS